jgi:hypothetical protein
MKRIALLASVLVFVALVGFAQAADKADPTGTWKWSFKLKDQTRDVTLKLQLDGDKLTGSMPGRNNQETKIEDGTFKDGEVSFTITRERNNQKFTSKYKGKVDGDTIKGTIESQIDGQTRSRDWEAKREK